MTQPLYTTLPVRWATRGEMLTVLPADSLGVEIGVWEGEFSSQIMKVALPACLWLVDPWAPTDSGDHFAQTAQEHHDAARHCVGILFFEQIQAGTVKIIRSKSVPAAATFRDQYLDWVYIDGNHTFEGVTADLRAWWPKVKSGGLVMGHDYLDYPLSTTRVKSAVDTWIREQGAKVVPVGQTSEVPRLPGIDVPPDSLPGTRSFMVRKEK